MIEDFLLQVQKPARYIGKEWNVAQKDFAKSKIKFALCFPDLYEVGMSNLGIRILYGILNAVEDVACERFFAPGIDMENLLRNKNLEMLSLESARPMQDFDLIGFSLGHELNYTNVLNILDLGAVPLESCRRTNRHPLVIAGGACALNPEPMHNFFDLFVVGEAEEVILEMINLYRKIKDEFKSSRLSKEEILIMFSGIQGVYVPSLYEVTYGREGKIEEFKARINRVPGKVKKRLVEDLDRAYFPLEWVVPYIATIHDRITLEVMRGCPNTCRFCQAKSQYFPFRKRSIKHILNLASEVYRRTGYEEISLAGLSVSDYPSIAELLSSLVEVFKEKGVSISLPSIKAKAVVGELSSLTAKIKKTSLTFAPEAATERLRRLLAKDFNPDEFFGILEQAYELGYQRVKLYFMIGLPQEKREDLEAILDFATGVSQLRKKTSNFPAEVNLSINTLIPKPHTPLQWLEMEKPEAIKEKQDYLKKIIKNKRLKLNFHNHQMSFLEGVLSRGDRRLSKVIYYAFKNGARFDAWGNHFRFEQWQEAFKAADINPEFYLKEKDRDEILPWDFLDIGIDKEVLIRESEKVGSV